jgi:hypothetical protein
MAQRDLRLLQRAERAMSAGAGDGGGRAAEPLAARR